MRSRPFGQSPVGIPLVDSDRRPLRQNAEVASILSVACWRRSALMLLCASTFLAAAPPFALTAQAQTATGNGNGMSDLTFAGDFRLRYEETTKQEPNGSPGRLDPRHRAVVRFRAGLSKKIGDLLNVNARVATGARGDPNTTDVTLGDFVDDLEISLERASLEFKYKDVFFTGGKFANPFLKGQLVWDDDVHPAGAALSYTVSRSTRFIPKFTGVYSIVDEQTVNPDSYMLGGQMQVLFRPAPIWTITLAGAYYDYRIRSLTKADPGDTLSNNLTPDGTSYLSDFNLADVVAIVDYPLMGERFPVRVVGNYVRNLGARVPEAAGYAFDVSVGRTSTRNDTRYRYGYSTAQTDAVLAAFSHDDTTFATDYRQHSLTFDYVASANLLLNATLYVYRRDSAAADGFISRVRVNAMVSF